MIETTKTQGQLITEAIEAGILPTKKLIPGTDHYYATYDGKIYNSKKKTYLNQWRNEQGYYMVCLRRETPGYATNYRVHRLMAEAYLDNPNNYKDVCHIDEDNNNNNLSNLEWNTHKNNCNAPKHKARLSEANAKQVYCFENNTVYYSASVAARELNICISDISKCCNGLRKTAHGKHFAFIEKEAQLEQID